MMLLDQGLPLSTRPISFRLLPGAGREDHVSAYVGQDGTSGHARKKTMTMRIWWQYRPAGRGGPAETGSAR
jgi:hypothetical protein